MTGSSDSEQGPRLVRAPPPKIKASVNGPGLDKALLSSSSLPLARSDSSRRFTNIVGIRRSYPIVWVKRWVEFTSASIFRL